MQGFLLKQEVGLEVRSYLSFRNIVALALHARTHRNTHTHSVLECHGDVRALTHPYVRLTVAVRFGLCYLELSSNATMSSIDLLLPLAHTQCASVLIENTYLRACRNKWNVFRRLMSFAEFVFLFFIHFELTFLV